MRLVIFLAYGLVWLFLFSIPLEGSTRLFQVGYYYIVDTKFVHFITDFVKEGTSKTTGAATGAAHEVINKVEEKGRMAQP
jgi:hypothetical protein